MARLIVAVSAVIVRRFSDISVEMRRTARARSLEDVRHGNALCEEVANGGSVVRLDVVGTEASGLSHSLDAFPLFLGVGPRPVRPLAVGDAVTVMAAALVQGRLSQKTVALVGPTDMSFDAAARPAR